jgi:peptidoglycan/xylan/chitin deacetylase (PgdA/CDA1 family)
VAADVRALLETIRRRVRGAAPRPLILMYHRIARPPIDPWALAVAPRHFEEHLDVLRSRTVLPITEFVDRLEHASLPDDAVAITFDDGYVDNLREAKPRLAAAGMPATIFVTTGALGQPREYWWDELARGILLHRGALDTEVTIAGAPCRIAISASETPRSWRAWEGAPTARETSYVMMWRRLRDTAADEREAVMSAVRALLDAPPPAADDRPLTPGELAELANGGVFDVGGHTVTHPALPTLTPTERAREIRESRMACERILNRPVEGFAYPHGAVDPESCAAVRAGGFRWACSTEHAPVRVRRYDRFALPRLTVSDCDGAAFERALQVTHT